MNQDEKVAVSLAKKAARFAALHVKGKPLVLYNAWDAGSAKAIWAAGARAIATSSYSVAAAQGYKDGEEIPRKFVEEIVGRIASTVDAPLSVDFEGGYSADSEQGLAENVSRLLDLGVIGINFEDRRLSTEGRSPTWAELVKGSGLYDIDRQARRIAAIHQAAKEKGVSLFVNARTDVFFDDSRDPARAVEAAVDRAKAYAAAGASGLFIPGLVDDELIGEVCERVALPVNVMIMDGVPPVDRLSQLGVARVSYGSIPYVQAMKALKDAALKAHS